MMKIINSNNGKVVIVEMIRDEDKNANNNNYNNNPCHDST